MKQIYEKIMAPYTKLTIKQKVIGFLGWVLIFSVIKYWLAR